MDTMQIITLVSCVLGMCVTIGSLIKPIINLNTAITKLDDIVSALQADMYSYKNDAKTLSSAISELQNDTCVAKEQIRAIHARLKIIEEKL